MHLGRLEPEFVVVWLALTAASTVLGSVWILRHRGARRRAVLGIFAVAAAACPVVVCVACFSGGGARPLVQYNDPERMGAWTAWSILWPLLLIAGLGAAFISLRPILSPGEAPLGRAVWAVVLSANALSLFAVLQNFPSA